MVKVSTTRGTPSTSTNLKEALCEKIPLHHDLIRKFRLCHGGSVISQITVEHLYQGLKGVGTTVRETSEIDPKFGVKYRGLTIPEVVGLLPRRGNSLCPEAVFWLLLTGDIPTLEQTASLTADWASRRQNLREVWSEKGGGTVGAVLQTLPKAVSPIGRLCVALTTLGTDKHIRKAVDNGAMSHTHWEYAYEDCMEVLAVLPAIIGLVSRTQDFTNFTGDGDWADVLVDCLGNIAENDQGKKSSLGDFLRLYITINADEDNGSPGAHVTQILGDSTLDPSQALAAGALAYGDEPNGGSMPKYMKFQTKLETYLGSKPTENAIRNYLSFLVQKEDDIMGYKESEFCDPRYIVLRNYARENLPEAPQVLMLTIRVKACRPSTNLHGISRAFSSSTVLLGEFSNLWLARTISKLLIPILKQRKSKNYWPEPNAIAAPIFQYYGLRDMEFNQLFLCMSRALGAIASIIWSRAVNATVERPKSSSTYGYMESIYKMKTNLKTYSTKYVKRK